jgi:hypothetical protein
MTNCVNDAIGRPQWTPPAHWDRRSDPVQNIPYSITIVLCMADSVPVPVPYGATVLEEP